MKDLDEYFNDARLVRILCRKRIEAARKTRRIQFIRAVSATRGEIPPATELSGLLPPRRVWNKFRPSAEARKDPDIDAPSRLTSSMCKHIMRELGRPTPHYRWVARLRAFLNGVRSQAMSWQNGDTFPFEGVFAFPKKAPGNNQRYRIVASYSLKQSLICSGFAAYLRDRVDKALKPAVLAFRSPQHDGTGPPPSHHDAVGKILELTERMGLSAPLWCAEADIEGFFDAVSHEIAGRETRRLLNWAGNEATTDPRLFSFLASFLAGYDYVGQAIPAAKNALAKHGISTPIFADPMKALVARGIAGGGQIGIPQGSAMSCVLANIVISAADTLVCAELETKGIKEEGLYLRYCDDIIIIHRNKSVCEAACNAYMTAMASLRLPCHPLKQIVQYPGSRALHSEHPRSFFWSAKSKAPYLWAASAEEVGLPASEAVPWLGFVGYQIRRDGRVRVRESSVEKELDKQRQVAVDIINSLRAACKKKLRNNQVHQTQDDGVIRYRAMMHLLSIGVGYPPEWGIAPAPGAVSWASGFKGMKPGHADHEALRRLDRGRNRVLSYLGARIRIMLSRQTLAIKPKTQQMAGKAPFRLRFAGRRLSYSYQFRQ